MAKNSGTLRRKETASFPKSHPNRKTQNGAKHISQMVVADVVRLIDAMKQPDMPNTHNPDSNMAGWNGIFRTIGRKTTNANAARQKPITNGFASSGMVSKIGDFTKNPDVLDNVAANATSRRAFNFSDMIHHSMPTCGAAYYDFWNKGIFPKSPLRRFAC